METQIPQPPQPVSSSRNVISKLPWNRIALWTLVVLVLFLLYWVGTEEERSFFSEDSQTTKEEQQEVQKPKDNGGIFSFGQKTKQPTKTVETSGAFKLVQKTAGACSGLVPDGWRSASNQEGSTAEFMSPDRTMYAGYGILGINPMLQIYDQELYSQTPEVSIRRLAQLVASGELGDASQLSYTNEYNEQIGEYRLRSLESAGTKGVVFYRIFPGDGYNTSYIEAARFALVRKSMWEEKGLLVARVASSIQCSTQLVQRDLPVVEVGSSGSATRDENGDEYGYNPQLGTEYAHNPNTGENFLVSPGENWSTDGPQGAGYYSQSGNTYIKLQPGRSD